MVHGPRRQRAAVFPQLVGPPATNCRRWAGRRLSPLSPLSPQTSQTSQTLSDSGTSIVMRRSAGHSPRCSSWLTMRVSGASVIAIAIASAIAIANAIANASAIANANASANKRGRGRQRQNPGLPSAKTWLQNPKESPCAHPIQPLSRPAWRPPP